MSNRSTKTLIVAAILSGAMLSAAGQAPSLRIVSANPAGELAQLADADQVRIVFSEPMIPLGTVPPPGAPPWIHIAPAVRGTFYWSGTTTLIFSPDPSALPFATTFTVRVDAAATSVSGHALSAPYELAFTTPTLRIVDTGWYRKNGRFDSPAVIVLRFNQPVRPDDVLAYTRVTLTPHGWDAPMLYPDARAELQHADPTGLARFDAKIAAVQRVVSASDAIGIRLAESWNERVFARAPERVVLETTTVPPPDGWLTVTLSDSLPAAQGNAQSAALSAVLRLEPTFFVARTGCPTACDPSADNPIQLTRPVTLGAFARTLAIADVTERGDQRPVVPVRDAVNATAWETSSLRVQDLGFDRQPPARTWRLQVGADLTAADGQALGYPWMGFVENAHAGAFISFGSFGSSWDFGASGGAVWEASGGPQIPLSARNVPSLTQLIKPIALSEVMSEMRWLQTPLPDSWLLPPTQSSRRRLGVTPDTVQAHGIDVSRLLSPGGTGVVWVAAAPGEVEPAPVGGAIGTTVRGKARASLVQVTNLGISVKDSPRSTLVFVTRLDSGAPVPGARVTIVDEDQGTRWRATTDRDGVALAPALTLRQPSSHDFSFIVTAEKDGDVAFLGSDWNGDVHPGAWNLRYGLDDSTSVLRGSVFTDRGVYKESETVHIKAVLRDDTPAGMRLISTSDALDVVVRDSRSHEVDTRTVRVNDWSSAEWTWCVPADAAFGRYRIEVSRPSSAESNRRPPVVAGEFLVAAFRRPDFRVETTLSGEPPVAGSTLSGSVEATYLFGAALGMRPVRWWFARQAVQGAPDAVRDRYPEARYAVGYVPGRNDSTADPQLPSSTTMLGADGRAIMRAASTAGGDAAYSYTFEADVEDVSGQHIGQRASLVVHPASLYVAMSRPPTFVETTAGTTVGIAAVDLSGRTVEGVPVTVSLLRQRWLPKGSSDRWGSVEWRREDVAAGEWTLRTSGAETPLPISVRDGGYYTLRAVAHDAAGRQTRTDLYFYALGPGASSWRGDGHRIDLTPERRTWKPGETARILIQSPWPRATALLTVEREGIRSHRTFTLASTHDTVDVPITEADVPNVYVSVMLVKGRTSTELAPDGTDAGQPSYRVGYAELSVDDASKRLRVDVSADRQAYRPRQAMKVSVAVAAPDGRPVPSEVTLWAMDYGLLSLTAYTTPDVLKAVYAPRTLQVMTEDNRQRLMSRRTLTDQEPDDVWGDAVAGIAVAGGGISIPGFQLRHDFRPLAFWLGSATTGADGRATTTVTLPDSITTYRIMAVAGDRASRFGFGEREVRTTKPLTLLPELPRFLTAGDRASIGAVVTNGGKADGTAAVTIQSLDPDSLQVGGVATQTVQLAAGASKAITFDALARRAGGARVRVSATLGVETDAFDMPLVVTAPVRLETTAAYGETVGTASERLTLPAGLVPGTGGLTVDLASTALVGLGEGARYLDEYPYDCAEQKASRALALLLASDVGGAFKLSGIEPGEYRAAGTSALQALRRYQCGDGGFSLWPGRCEGESPYLTAYVLHVMKVADALHVPPDSDVVERALNYVEWQLREPPPEVGWWRVWGASQAYSLKMLAEFGRAPRGQIKGEIDRLAGMAERLPVFALSYLADALAASDDKGPRYQEIVRRLTNALRVEADRAHVEEVDDDALGWLWNTNVRATAVVLDGISRRRDDATLAAPLARWLVAARTNGRWGTTHENAMALEALVTYYRAFEQEEPRMTATVAVGSAVVGSAAFNGRSAEGRQLRVSMPDLLQQIAAAPSPALSISRAGTGRLYYTARIQYAAPEPPDAADRGFLVERRYERYDPDDKDGTSPEMTSFSAGDLIRVTIAVTLRGEGRYLALADPLPAGVEPIESWFHTTSSDLAREATSAGAGNGWLSRWRRGGFDYVEKHDDRVLAFATRLGSGRHQLSYLVRATTAGTFGAQGARLEAMYAPELNGRSQAATIIVR